MQHKRDKHRKINKGREDLKIYTSAYTDMKHPLMSGSTNWGRGEGEGERRDGFLDMRCLQNATKGR